MISQLTIQKVLDAADIVDVVSEFVTIKKAGVNYKGLCPFHDDRTPSFTVSPVKNICKCFACGEGGDAVHFLMKHENLSYPEAIRYLAKKYSIELEEETDRKVIERRKKQEALAIVNAAAQEFFVAELPKNEEAYEYAVIRFGADYIKEQGIGFAPDSWDGLLNPLR